MARPSSTLTDFEVKQMNNRLNSYTKNDISKEDIRVLDNKIESLHRRINKLEGISDEIIRKLDLLCADLGEREKRRNFQYVIRG